MRVSRVAGLWLIAGFLGLPEAQAKNAREMLTFLANPNVPLSQAVDALHLSQPDPDPGEQSGPDVPLRAVDLAKLSGFLDDLTEAEREDLFWRARGKVGDYANSDGFTSAQRRKWERLQVKIAQQWLDWYFQNETDNTWTNTSGPSFNVRKQHYALVIYYLGDGLVSVGRYPAACEHFSNYSWNEIYPTWIATWTKALFGSQEMLWDEPTIDTLLCTAKDDQNRRKIDSSSLARWKRFSGALKLFLAKPNVPTREAFQARLELLTDRLAKADARLAAGNAPVAPGS